jgi:hypothetical protein
LFNKLQNLEVDLHLSLAMLSNSLTRSQQINFGEILGLVNTVYVTKEIEVITKIPSSFEDLQRLYLDGDLSIQKQVPVPDVTSVNKHSVVSILDCVTTFLLRNKNIINNWETDFSKLEIETKSNENIFDSKRIRDIVPNGNKRVKLNQNDCQTIFLFIKKWSDNLDPSKAIKSKRQSVD